MVHCKNCLQNGHDSGKIWGIYYYFPPFSWNIENDIRKKKNTDTRPHKLHAYVEEERRKGERDKRKKRKGAKERHLPGDASELDRCKATWKSERWDQNEVYYEKYAREHQARAPPSLPLLPRSASPQPRRKRSKTGREGQREGRR